MLEISNLNASLLLVKREKNGKSAIQGCGYTRFRTGGHTIRFLYISAMGRYANVSHDISPAFMVVMPSCYGLMDTLKDPDLRSALNSENPNNGKHKQPSARPQSGDAAWNDRRHRHRVWRPRHIPALYLFRRDRFEARRAAAGSRRIIRHLLDVIFPDDSQIRHHHAECR